jgi:isopenicillin N synthase-like dioxygenase
MTTASPPAPPATALPHLSLARLSAGDPSELRALRAACASPGFLYLRDHGVAPELQERVLRLARDFFLGGPSRADGEGEDEEAEKADGEEVAPHKAAVARASGGGARGYQRVGENVTGGRRDAHEALDLYREWDAAGPSSSSPSSPSCSPVVEANPLAEPNRWPAHPPALRPELEEYIGAALGVGRRLVAAMGAALELRPPDDGDVFVRETERSFWVCRLVGYPPRAAGAGDEEVGCGEHTGRWCPAPLFLFLDEGVDLFDSRAYLGFRLWLRNPPTGRFDPRRSPGENQRLPLDRRRSRARRVRRQHRGYDGAMDEWRVAEHSPPRRQRKLSIPR